nr:hypothetical protein [Tanacetum cinerariifolium]
MTTPTFVETHNLVLFLGKPTESAGFEQIIDFLKSKPIYYALTVNLTIYVSCVKQFWATAKVKNVNDQVHIQALVDKKKVIITEDNIRSDLRFDDAEGTACLLNEAIFEGLACMSAKTTAWNEFSSIMASVIICLADKQVEGMARHKEMYIISSHTKKIFSNMKRIGAGFSRVITHLFDTMRKEAEVSHDESQDEEHVPIPSSDPLPSGEDSFTLNELMVCCTNLQEHVLDLQEAKADQAKEIAALKKKGRTNDDEMFGADDLVGEEGVMDTTTVTTTVKVSDAPITDVTKNEITMAQALAASKSTKPKVVVQEQEMSTTILAAATTVTTVVPTPRAKCIVFHEQKQSKIPIVSSSKDKCKAKMIEPKIPIKKKDQMRIDEEYARKLETKEQEASRLSRAQQDEEANNS